MNAVTAHLADLIARAAAGVDYRPRTGALCPGCGRPAKIYKTMGWDGNTRIRYHRCRTDGCLLCAARATIKSVEEDR